MSIKKILFQSVITFTILIFVD